MTHWSLSNMLFNLYLCIFCCFFCCCNCSIIMFFSIALTLCFQMNFSIVFSSYVKNFDGDCTGYTDDSWYITNGYISHFHKINSAHQCILEVLTSSSIFYFILQCFIVFIVKDFPLLIGLFWWFYFCFCLLILRCFCMILFFLWLFFSHNAHYWNVKNLLIIVHWFCILIFPWK
jgi:hypothetical protein